MGKDVSKESRRVGAFVAGAAVFLVAAFLGVSLLLGIFSLLPAQLPLAVPGNVLFSAYGFSSVLVPVFLLAASILLLVPGWTIRSGVLLTGSFAPFFTVAGGERFIRHLSASLVGSGALGVIVAGLVVSIALAVIVEYLLLLLLADAIAARLGSAALKPNGAQGDSASVSATVPDVGQADEIGAESSNELTCTPEDNAEATRNEAEASANASLDAVIDRAITASPEAEPEVESSAEPVASQVAEAVTVSAGVAERKAEAANASVPSAKASTADPTYVDFEKMRAPFDLPVLESWVDSEDAQGEPALDAEAAEGDGPAQDSVAAAIATDLSGHEGIALEGARFVEDTRELPRIGDLDEPGADDYEGDETIADGDDEFAMGDDGLEAEETLEPSGALEEEVIDDTIIDDLLEGDMEAYVPNSEVAVATQGAAATQCADSNGATGTTALQSSDALVHGDLPPVVSVPPQVRVQGGEGVAAEASGGAIATVAKLFKKKPRVPYSVPYDILNSYPDGEYWIVDDTTRRAAVALKETLNEFRIEADVTGIRKGPVITMFEILPAPGVKLSKIVGLQDNIALRLAASSVRIVAPIPGKHAVGIEVPNQKRAIVSFRELIETDTPQAKKMEIPVVLGKDITGEAQLLDLASTPHLLIAGSTGSGKSVCVNSIILSILYKRSPEDVKLILIDPKIVELKLYNDIGHLLSPVITEPKKAFQALQYCLCEMERRYALLDGMGVRDIKSYNRRIKERNIAAEKLPYIVIIIDEFADLMATTGKELESTVARLCAMSRAVGIHLVLATQRPSIDVITGLIKANIPTRIAFMVASKMDSRIIIDQVGAEKLLGRGDMLYASATDPFPVRIQGAYVSEEEVERVVERVKELGEPEYIDEEMFVDDDEDEGVDSSLFSDGEDPLYDKALEIVLLAGKASASYIQRKLKIGYNRAARLVEDMEARGIVGPANGSKPRDVMHRPS
jgi:S-DNA-T family DNA segregation ATPase FtsK/SpoIIIE